MSETLEAKARQLLARAGVPDVDTYTAGDLVEIADLLAPPVGTLEVRHTPEGSTEVRLEIGALHLTHRTNASGIPPGTYTIHRSEP